MKSIYNRYLHNFIPVVFSIVALLQVSCKKSWLDAKPNKALVVPSSIADYQAILDNNTGNSLFNFGAPSLPEIGAGDFYLRYTSWQSLSNTQERNAYIWNADIYAGETGFDWNNAYKRILNENIVLDGIKNVPLQPGDQASWNNVKGTALFYRAFDFWCLAQEYAKPYDSNTASTDLGIPIRTSSDINVRSVRATVLATYNQIVNDLTGAKPLLPDSALYPTRPGKAAVYGLLARVFLSESNYSNAALYADSCLRLSNQLLDFNTLSTSASTPIKRFNVEVIYHHNLSSYSAFNNSSPNLIIDSNLYNSYKPNDLRKQIYFKMVAGFPTWKSTYTGTSYFFGGLATDEIYLIRAECFARQNNTTAAMKGLNQLLAARSVTGTFTPSTAASADDALSQILTERRKELVFRGLRWSDLKRINKETSFAKTLTRILNGQTYSLQPNSNLYVFPIPPAEIQLSGIQQNPR
ncbi:RagB/SusD family nutrient uptake outer membrane protein [Mucilaginibacter sp. L196]|uniref:RagB/SusD family nutrient uptake outer membrane protein n=1 Tax=Mucilaginibacter sp. L196 TaxID=1641870 RepID=UPI00131C146D|nr:RagB/SusD family nutrient uptake outer membrane protein [Mucilaginibacter sp. L196]